MRVLPIVLLLLLAITANATTYTVNSPLDFPDDDIGDGVCDSTLGTFCTLRAAIQEANSDSTADTIVFSFSSGSDILAIVLTNGALPTITQTLSIDGRTVAGYDDSSGDIQTSRPRMFLFGANTTGGADGFRFSGSGASYSSVYGFGIIDFADNGIEIANSAVRIKLDANWIGLHWSDNSARANAVGVEAYADYTSIGTGGFGGIGNMIAGNTNEAIVGAGTGLLVALNRFGYSANATALPNGGTALTYAGASADVRDNRIKDHINGIEMVTSNSTIFNNKIFGSESAINLVGNNLTVTSNEIQHSDHAITLTGSGSSLVHGNLMFFSDTSAIYIDGGTGSSDSNDITNNWIYDATGAAAIFLDGGDDNLISGNTLTRITGSGIRVHGDDNFVADNNLGFDIYAGEVRLDPIEGNGIVIAGNSNNVGRNRDLEIAPNVIATGSADWMDGVDVWFGASYNFIGHNYIGVRDSPAYEQLGIGGEGIRLDHTPGSIVYDNVIGFAQNGVRVVSTNQISRICGNRIGVGRSSSSVDIGNRNAGVYIEGNYTSLSPASGCAFTPTFNYIGNNHIGVLVEGNSNGITHSYIGLDSGAIPAPNDTHGVLINLGEDNTVNSPIIGYNGGNGVVLSASAGSGNDIWAGTHFLDNAGGFAIDLGDDGITANDPGDIDSGPNLRMNYPSITGTVPSPGAVTISYRLDYDNATTNSANVYFYLDNDDGRGGGFFVASDSYTVTANSIKTIAVTVPGNVFPGTYYLRSRAIDSNGNSSEFSDSVTVTVQAPSDVIFEDSFED